MFTNRRKLFLGGAVLAALLLVAVGYFVSRWLFGSDVEFVTEYVLSDDPLPAQIPLPVRASVSRDASSIPETDLVSEDNSISDIGSEIDADETPRSEELASLSDEELTALVEVLEQDVRESSKYPEVPDGFPMTPVWLEDYFSEGNFSDHVTIYRVLIELWNQGDRNFVDGSYDHNNGKIYPIYPDVIYITLDSYFYDGPNGETIEMPYISSTLGYSGTVEPLTDAYGHLFTTEEMESGAYKTKYPGIKLVDYDSAGYDPASVLNDY